MAHLPCFFFFSVDVCVPVCVCALMHLVATHKVDVCDRHVVLVLHRRLAGASRAARLSAAVRLRCQMGTGGMFLGGGGGGCV